MAGFTVSGDSIATAGSYQDVNNGGDDAFLAKFDIAGNRLWATYYGGSNNDVAYGVSCDLVGNVFIAGATSSTSDIATPGTYQSTFNDSSDAFVAKFDTATTNAVPAVQPQPARLSLYPSPNNGNFVVSGVFPNTITGVCVDIINIAGSSVYSHTATLQNGILNERVQLADLPGTYILSVTAANTRSNIIFTIQ